jgi:Flp pilus assembly protein TadD
VDSHRDQEVVTYDYALYRLGLSQYAQDKMVDAESTLRRAIQIQSKGFGYHLALGATLKHQGKLVEAKQQFELELSLRSDAEAAGLLQEVEQQLNKNESPR